MTTAEVEGLTAKVDAVHTALTRLEERMAAIETRELGKIRTAYTGVVRVEGVCGGRPIVEGTRLSVKLIVGWLRIGLTPEAIMEQYPELSAAEIAGALAYYRDHPEEIDAEFAEEQRYLDVELPRLQRMIEGKSQM